MKNNKFKVLAVMLITVMICVCFVACVDPDTMQVTVSIDCTSLLQEKYYDNLDAKYQDKKIIPSNGIVLDKTIRVKIGATVLDSLKAAAQKNKIQLGFNNGYVPSINNIEQGLATQYSGWTYTVNDQIVMEAADKYILKEGDIVKWEFICEWEF